jgi:carbon monoxide dehydrogenase subunit G
LSFARGALDITLRVAERAPDTFLRVVGHSKGIGSTSDVEARLTLEPQEAGTRVLWGVDVLQLGGLLKAVPRGLIQAAAQKVIADAWAGVEQNLGVG